MREQRSSPSKLRFETRVRKSPCRPGLATWKFNLHSIRAHHSIVGRHNDQRRIHHWLFDIHRPPNLNVDRKFSESSCSALSPQPPHATSAAGVENAFAWGSPMPRKRFLNLGGLLFRLEKPNAFCGTSRNPTLLGRKLVETYTCRDKHHKSVSKPCGKASEKTALFATTLLQIKTIMQTEMKKKIPSVKFILEALVS